MSINDVPTVFSWRTFSRYLASIGIEKSVAALESLHRRHGLPVRRGGVRGRQVILTRGDIGAWVRFLTGVSLELWLEQLRIDRAAGVQGELDRAFPTARSQSDIDYHLAPLLAMTVTPLGAAETVHRLESGYVYGSTNSTIVEEWGGDAPPGMNLRHWRYSTCSVVTAAQCARGWRSRSKEATSLIAAVEINNGKAKFCRVPGPLFGLAEGTETRMVISPKEPRFSEVIDHCKEHFPDAIYLRWSRRKAILPITLENETSDDDDLLDEILHEFASPRS